MKYQHDTVNSFSFLCGMSVFCLGPHSMKITLVGVLVVEENLIHKKPSYFQPITDQFQIES